MSSQQRLNRIKGQINGIERMLTEGRECVEIVNQIQAVRASLASLGQEVLKDEAVSCTQTGSEQNQQKRFAELVKNLFNLT